MLSSTKQVHAAVIAVLCAAVLSACSVVSAQTANTAGNGSAAVVSSTASSDSQNSSSSEPESTDPSQITWATTDNGNGTVTITGYDAGGLELSGKIELPASCDGKAVNAIGDKAFRNCNKITTIEIPASVETIGDSAFQYCTALKSVYSVGGLKQIGKRAFEGCTSLSSVSLPNTLRMIDEHAFANCTALESFVVPGNIYGSDTTIILGSCAFEGCTALKKVFIPAGVKEFDQPFDAQTALTDIYYGGTEAEWSAIKGKNDEAILAAEVHYSAKESDVIGTTSGSSNSGNSSSSTYGGSSGWTSSTSSSTGTYSSSDASSSTVSSSSSSSASSKADMTATYRKKILERINYYRTAENTKEENNALAMLKMDDPDLTAAAQTRAKELANDYSYFRTDENNSEESGCAIIDDYGIKYSAVGEAIAQKCYTDPDLVVDYWMTASDDNAGCYSKILNKNYTTVGIGYYEAGGTTYWDVLFICAER